MRATLSIVGRKVGKRGSGQEKVSLHLCETLNGPRESGESRQCTIDAKQETKGKMGIGLNNENVQCGKTDLALMFSITPRLKGMHGAVEVKTSYYV